MIASWTPEVLQTISPAVELQIAVTRPDGTERRWVPIWVVCVDERVFVRTWYRRTTGWFGHALNSRRARIRVPGLEADVKVDDLGEAPLDLLDDVDAAYRSKYGRYGQSAVAAMISGEARATTLQLSPR